MSDDKIKKMHMLPAKNIRDALEIARKITGENAKIVAIPDGVSVIVKE